MTRHWGEGNQLRAIYKLDKSRLGHNKHNWLFLDDDKVLCVAHSGDCFYDYVPVQKQDDGTFKALPDLKFGAYCLTRKFCEPIPEKDFHGLLAGLNVDLGI